MTQEEKSTLLKDLCCRLPHGVRVFYEYLDDLDGKTYGYSLTLNTWCIDEFNANKAIVKPYLRPLSSMTEEEKKERNKFVKSMADSKGYTHYIVFPHDSTYYTDWLNANHFDYHGLIELELALEAPKDMY